MLDELMIHDFELLDKKRYIHKYPIIETIYHNPNISLENLSYKLNISKEKVLELIDKLEPFNVVFSLNNKWFSLNSRGYKFYEEYRTLKKLFMKKDD